MKKLFISSLVLVAVSSCTSSNDSLSEVNNNNNDNTPILLMKATEITASGQAYVAQFKYNGDKLVETSDISGGTEKTVYTYNGDDIIKTEEYENGVMKFMREFTYSNGKVVSEKTTNKHSGTLVHTKTFQYISDNHVKFTNLTGSTYNPSTGQHSNLQYSQNEVYLSSNGNLATVTSVENGKTTNSTYTYDIKNTPMKNVKGYIKINLFLSLDGELGNNNLLSSSSNYSGISSWTQTSSAAHTYNGNNYPTKTAMTYTSSEWGTKTHTFLYEYNK